jgi:hypothetical protein
MDVAVGGRGRIPGDVNTGINSSIVNSAFVTGHVPVTFKCFTINRFSNM